MKKILLLAACFMGLTSWAAETVITMSNFTSAVGNSSEDVITWNTEGFTIVADKAEGGNVPTVNASAGDLRVYANGVLTISTDVPMTSISFELSANGVKRACEITPSVGAITEQGANPLVWNGNANNVSFTVGEKAVYGTDGATKAGQFDFLTVTIVTNGNPSVTPDPDPEPEPEPDPDNIVYKGLVDNADDWTFVTLWPEEGVDVAVWDEKYGIKFNGYYDGAKQETEAVVYSPWIDLSDYKNCKLSFDHALNYLDASKYDLSWFLAVCAYDEEAAESEDAGIYEELEVPTWPAGKNWTFVNSGEIDLSSFDGKWMNLYFYYYSGPTEEQYDAFEEGEIGEDELVNVAGTWEIKNFVITGTNLAGVREVIFDSNAPVEYYNLNGIRVNEPSKGIYIVRQGNKVNKVVVK